MLEKGERIPMLYFKSCPKCVTGTVEHNYDTHGEFAQCLNCGFMRDLPDGASAKSFNQLLASWRNELGSSDSERTQAVA